jgi:phosphatidylinositol alpha-1,6-mannosyltransferase
MTTKTPGRVLVVTNDFPTRVGGIETFVLAMCESMPPDRVVVYTASMTGAQEYDAGLAFPVYRDPSGMLLPTPAVGRRVAEVMRRHSCDRVLFGASAPLGLLAPVLRRAGADRIIALTHGHEVWWARTPVARLLLRRIGDTTDTMTYVSEWCRGRIAPALSPRARERMRRLSPGVDTGRFYPGCGGAEVRDRLGLATGRPVVVCTGRLVRRKGQDSLLKAWPTVLRTSPDAVLLLVGEGPARRRLGRIARARGIVGSVIFAGRVAWSDVPAYMDAGTVFAMPCRTRRWGLEVEAWGIVFLEAQACGLPVVIGDSGGAPETLASADRGEVWRAGGAALASAITRQLERGAAVRASQPARLWTWADAAACLARLWDQPEASPTCR